MTAHQTTDPACPKCGGPIEPLRVVAGCNCLRCHYADEPYHQRMAEITERLSAGIPKEAKP